MSKTLTLELLNGRQELLTKAHDVLRADLRDAVDALDALDAATLPKAKNMEALDSKIRDLSKQVASLLSLGLFSRMSAVEAMCNDLKLQVEFAKPPMHSIAGPCGDVARRILEQQLRTSRETWRRPRTAKMN